MTDYIVTFYNHTRGHKTFAYTLDCEWFRDADGSYNPKRQNLNGSVMFEVGADGKWYVSDPLNTLGGRKVEVK